MNAKAPGGLWKRQRRKQTAVAYFLISPTLLIFLIFTLAPVVFALYMSFTNYNILSHKDWIGLDNYRRLASDDDFANAVRVTLQYTLEVVPLNLAISLGLALLINMKIRGLAFFRSAYYMPVVTSMIAVSMVWLWLYDPTYGLFNKLLSSIGLPEQTWLKDPGLALHAMVLLKVWKGVGANMVIFLAGLQGIPKELYEAASLDGASSLRKLWSVTIPLLRPTTFFVIIMTTIGTMQSFGEVYAMTGGGPSGSTTNLVYLIYTRAFERMEMGYASAIATVLFALILLLTVINMTLVRGKADEAA